MLHLEAPSASSISDPTRTAGVGSDLLDWIPPSSDLYAQPICHRWWDFSVVDIGNPLRSIDLPKICSLCLISTGSEHPQRPRVGDWKGVDGWRGGLESKVKGNLKHRLVHVSNGPEWAAALAVSMTSHYSHCVGGKRERMPPTAAHANHTTSEEAHGWLTVCSPTVLWGDQVQTHDSSDHVVSKISPK